MDLEALAWNAWPHCLSDRVRAQLIRISSFPMVQHRKVGRARRIRYAERSLDVRTHT